MKLKFIVHTVITAILTITFFSCMDSKTEQTQFDLVSIIPDNSLAIFHLKDVEKAISEIEENELYNELLQSSFFANLKYGLPILKNIDSLSADNGFDSEAIISSHIFGRNETDFIYTIRNASIAENLTIEKLQKNVFKDSCYVKQQYNSNDIYEVGKGSGFFCKVNDIIIFSQKEYLLKQLVRELNTTNSNSKRENFNSVIKTSSKRELISAYVHVPSVRKILSKTKKSNIVDFIVKSSGWIELDVNLKKDYILCNGFSLINDSAKHNLYKLKNNPEEKLTFESAITHDITDVVAINIVEGKNILNIKNGKDTLTNNFLNTLVTDHVENQMIVFEIPSANNTQNKYVSFNVKSTSLLNTFLNDYAVAYSKSININPDSIINKRKVNNTELNIYYFDKTISSNLSNIVDLDFSKYWFAYNGYLIGTNSLLSADLFILKKQRGSSYSNIETSKKLKSRSANKSTVTIDIPMLNQSVFNINSSLRWQIMMEDGLAYNNILIQKSNAKETKKTDQFFTKIDTACYFIQKVINHNKPKEDEFFVQDKKNKIYLISGQGKILWSKKIDGKILSEINQVDFYKNRKLQYLFNTKNKVYVIDRNGDNVEKYPMSLKNDATNGLALVDYSNNRKYRYFVATNDKKIRCFDMSGSELKGWCFEKTEGVVSQKIQHILHDTKDYIIASDEAKVYILNRKGETRIKVNRPLHKPLNSPFFISVNNNELYFNATDTDNRLLSISSKGKLEYSENKKPITITQSNKNKNKLDILELNKNEITITVSDNEKYYYSTDEDITEMPKWNSVDKTNNIFTYYNTERKSICAIDNKAETVIEVRSNNNNPYLLYKSENQGKALTVLITDNQGVILICN